MGSKSPENGHQGHHAPPLEPTASKHTGGQPRGSHKSRDGDGCLGEGSGDNDESDGDADQVGPAEPCVTNLSDATAARQKRKKPRKKKPKKKAAAKQSSPPRVLLTDLFPTGNYPEGELQDYSAPRVSSAELRCDDRLLHWRDESWLTHYRKAAEVHRQTRLWVQETVKPGQSLHTLAEGIEDSVRALLGNAGLEPGDGLKSGLGFPTGLCLNHQVAHYTPNPGQKEVILQASDVLTVDFGVHINGWIVDSAFTMVFEPTYDALLEAVKDATNTGIRTAGIDVRISDVSAAIQEAMESHEIDIRGKTYPVKPVRNLSAHTIAHYRIHGGKSIPFVKNHDQTKMEEGEVFAIETFGSTGRGSVADDVGIYGYGLNKNTPLRTPVHLSSARRVHKTIRDNFSTLVFCRRYLERLGVERYLAGMDSLINAGVVEQYVPLADIKGSYSAQFEHTFLLHPTHKEVLSRGHDY